MWADEDRILSFTRSRNDWESSFSKTSMRSFKPTSLFALADLDIWDNAGLFKAQSSAQYGMAAVSGLGLLSNTCAVGFGQMPPRMRQWMPMSDPALENVPGVSVDPLRRGELSSFHGERGSRRAELGNRLQETQQRLGDQNEPLGRGGPQRHVNNTAAQLLDMRHKEKANLHQPPQGVRLRQPGKAQYNGEAFTQLPEHENQGQDTTLIREALLSVKEVSESLRSELKMVKQSLELSQTKLCELRAERDLHAQQMSTLQAQNTQLIKEKEEILGDRNTREDELAEQKEEGQKLRDTLSAVQAEHQRLQDQCLFLESEVLEKEEELGLKTQKLQKEESERLRVMEELRVMASFWNEKWQEAALSLTSTQRELKALRQKDPAHKLQDEATKLAAEVEYLQTEQYKDKEEIKVLLRHKANIEAELKRTKSETHSLLRVELDACKQQLELERNRNKAMVHPKMGQHSVSVGEAVQTLDKETMTALSMPPKIAAPVTSSCCRTSQFSGWPNDMPQDHMECIGAPCMTQQLVNMEMELKEKEHALEVQEILRDAEQSDAESKISALKLKDTKGPSPECQNTNSIGLTDHDRQRRMVTEQLKTLFKEQKESWKASERQPAPQAHAYPPHEMASRSQAIKSHRQQELLRCRNELYGPGLEPVSEEEEEEEEGEEEEIKETQEEQR